jgi:hypothetical protein
MTKLDEDALLKFLGHYRCDTPNTHNKKFWVIASNGAIQAGGKNSCMYVEVQGHGSPIPNPKRLLVYKKK